MVTHSELKWCVENQIKINGQEKDCFLAAEKKCLLLNQSKTIVRLIWESKNCLITKKTKKKQVLFIMQQRGMTIVLPWIGPYG